MTLKNCLVYCSRSNVYNKDIQGSTTNIIDSEGSNCVGYSYDDFGTATVYSAKNSIENEITYTGAVYDSSTGLYYMNARYYDSEIGRFISQDTYRGEKNDAGTWHLYAYCANDPINYVDPSGHVAVAATVAIGWIVSDYLFSAGISVLVTGQIYNILNKDYSNNVALAKKASPKIKKAAAVKRKVTRGTGRPPKQKAILANKIYEQITNKGKVLTRTFYNPRGQQLIRQDFGHSHFDKAKQVMYKLHQHIYKYNSAGQRIGEKVTKIPKGWTNRPLK